MSEPNTHEISADVLARDAFMVSQDLKRLADDPACEIFVAANVGDIRSAARTLNAIADKIDGSLSCQ